MNDIAVDVFRSTQAQEFVDALLQADPENASGLLTRALKSVAEAGDTLDAGEAARGQVAVAVLLAEERPSVLDGAPHESQFREYLHDLDTELTPARRVLCRAVVYRMGVSEENEWLDGLPDDASRASARVLLDRLAGMLVDG